MRLHVKKHILLNLFLIISHNMDGSLITIKSQKVNEYLHHVDLKAYGAPRILSVYIAEFDDATLLFDSGSSLDTKKLVKYLKKKEIELSTIKYIMTSHGHFDHNGGLWQLNEILKKDNRDFKILTTEKTKELLNNFEYHLNRAKRTYGNFVGIMKTIEENAFKIITPSEDPHHLEILDTFHVNDSEVNLAILSTPGHTPDHQCPLLIKNGKVEFMFFGEAVGTIYHSSKLVTMPTSMPVLYNHSSYMASLQKIKQLIPERGGFSHFGLVNGRENVKKIIDENEFFTEEFRTKIIQYYNEKPETRYVVEKITPLLMSRTDLTTEHNPTFNGIILGIVYGMMMDLGYRKD